jgi:hypothetical protein
MFASCLTSGLFIAGVERLRPLVAWDATHPTMFFAAFAIGLSVNVGAMADTVWRFKHNSDAQERPARLTGGDHGRDRHTGFRRQGRTAGLEPGARGHAARLAVVGQAAPLPDGVAARRLA